MVTSVARSRPHDGSLQPIPKVYSMMSVGSFSRYENRAGLHLLDHIAFLRWVEFRKYKQEPEIGGSQDSAGSRGWALVPRFLHATSNFNIHSQPYTHGRNQPPSLTESLSPATPSASLQMFMQVISFKHVVNVSYHKAD